MKDYVIKSKEPNLIKPYLCRDGSLSINSINIKETFHSSIGAKSEAINKFLLPSEINRFKGRTKIKILDVCLGLGYNSACILNELFKTKINIKWYGLEIDKRPLKLALDNQRFKSYWNKETLNFLDLIYNTGEWNNKSSEGKILWGDARKMIKSISKRETFDLILMDAFSPNNCPELWTKEFLNNLSERLEAGGRIITYCRAAAIRKTFREAGLNLRSMPPIPEEKNIWSSGTIAIRPKSKEEYEQINRYHNELSRMEEEHMLTTASIPYRDPTGKDTSQDILKRRNNEQKFSSLEKTKDWKLRWANV